jgi:cell division protein FtsI (penicillin-binding protein 3)
LAVAARAYSRGLPREKPADELRRARILWLLVAASLLAAAVWGRLVYWQVLQHQTLTADADAQYSKVVALSATRGRVLDRNLRPLAVNTTVYSVFVAPDQVPPEERELVAGQLSSVLSIPRDDVLTLLVSDRKFAYVAKRQTPDKADRLRTLKLPGVGVEPESQRSYLPGGAANTTLASNLLGFVNYAGAGQYGIEGY